MALHHALHADGERDRDNGGQRLRDRRHRQCDPENEHLDERLAADQAQPDDDRDDDEGGFRQRMPHAVEVLLERRPARLHGLEHARDPAELGVHAGGGDHRATAAVGRGRAGKGHVAAVTDREAGVVQRAGVLFGRHRFAGQGRFLDLQVDRFDQPRIGRHAVAGSQQDHVAGHELPGRDLALLPATEHGRGGGGHAAESVGRPLRAVLLREPEQNGKQDDGRDRNRLRTMSQYGG